MNELLTALVAASKVGFAAPRCRPCIERPMTRFTLEGKPLPEPVYCPTCHATGLDASDPARLIGRAMVWLLTHNNPAIHAYPATVRFVNYTEAVAMLELDQAHDGTPASLATALLRLVTRVGGAS